MCLQQRAFGAWRFGFGVTGSEEFPESCLGPTRTDEGVKEVMESLPLGRQWGC